MNKGYVYILASDKNGTLYTGVTSDLHKRIWEHKTGIFKGFSAKYNIKYLVYYEEGESIESAIAREKFIKRKSRKYKLDLIEKDNPNWDDLSKSWFETE
ncbi:GIY-YIG nuclease family protein [Candidatus Kapabacteria bacterium]|nr:GIY-YIG nuclease family protein [Candidatus Kapabacteria bacterium]